MKKKFALPICLLLFASCGPKTSEQSNFPNQQLKFIRGSVEVENKKQLNCDDLVLFSDHDNFFAQQDMQALRPEQKFIVYAQSECQYNGHLLIKNYEARNSRYFSIANFISTGTNSTPASFVCNLSLTLLNQDQSSKTYIVENTTINNAPCMPRPPEKVNPRTEYGGGKTGHDD